MRIGEEEFSFDETLNNIFMQQLERQCIGIDCAKDSFASSLSVVDRNRDVKHLIFKEFSNTPEGFKNFAKWVNQNVNSELPLLFVMEATGVYHERLACFLYDNGNHVSVVLPKRARDFSRTLKVKTINDKIAAKYLAEMGLEKKLELWKRPQQVFMQLRQLTRERERLQQQLTAVKNELHAISSGEWDNKHTTLRLNQQIEFLTNHVNQVMKDIKVMLKKHPELNQKINRIITIPGVALLTAVTVVAETRGFDQIVNKRQLISYSGYDIEYHDSGTSVSTKARISKKGNRHIRRAMHMPALSSIRYVEENKNLFVRIVGKTGIKMKGVVAVQRKLLVMIYTLWKNEQKYDPNYEEKSRAAQSHPTRAGLNPLSELASAQR